LAELRFGGFKEEEIELLRTTLHLAEQLLSATKNCLKYREAFKAGAHGVPFFPLFFDSAVALAHPRPSVKTESNVC
jgi:hypothetical protein